MKDFTTTNFSQNVFDFEQSQVLDKDNKTSKTEVGDYVRLGYRIAEGEKERVQAFEGVVIARGGGLRCANATITIRRTNQGYAVERIFPCFSPRVDYVKVLKKSKVRRAKLFYLRELKGKKARLKERFAK
ncbi:MAG: 50S ribosomal protein L19 [SAR324 cluster bacterium]|nr:50S ribosomal protein L19 [SAR324 cluster bacterium]